MLETSASDSYLKDKRSGSHGDLCGITQIDHGNNGMYHLFKYCMSLELRNKIFSVEFQIDRFLLLLENLFNILYCLLC